VHNVSDPQQTLQLWGAKTMFLIFLSQTGVFSLVYIKFYCADDILNTARDALTPDFWVASQQIVRGFRLAGQSGTPRQPVKSTGYMIGWRRESNAPYMQGDTPGAGSSWSKRSPEAEQARGAYFRNSLFDDVTEDQHQRHFLVWGNFLMIPSRYQEENEKVTVGTWENK
jgi:hypothetical protein